jgi:hypothetical protein
MNKHICIVTEDKQEGIAKEGKKNRIKQLKFSLHKEIQDNI